MAGLAKPSNPRRRRTTWGDIAAIIGALAALVDALKGCGPIW
jgi:hypothetical protein